MERSEEQAARNEITFREANERIAERLEEIESVDGPAPFLCECEEPACTEIVRLTAAEYAQVRSDPTQFVIATGHKTRGDETPHRGEGWVCVVKSGISAELAGESEVA
jgi:hypothetical protein